MALLQVEHLKKIYTTRFGAHQVQALSDVSFSVQAGEFVAIMGESGSGKTTLLNILATLDRPTQGAVRLNGQNLADVPDKQLSAFRRQRLGFVFQDFNLLDTFSLKDNILLPLVLSHMRYDDMVPRLKAVSDVLGITQLLEKYPYEVSGGQKQRAAVARALITRPAIVLADEKCRSGTHMCAAAAFFVCLWLPAACLQKRKPAAGRCKRTLWHCSLYAGIIKSRTGALPCHIRQARAQRKGDREYGFAAGRASEKDIHHTLWRAPGAGAERRFLFRAGRGVRGHHG